MQKSADIYILLVFESTILLYNIHFHFVFCACSMYHSKTKNRQWILFVSSRTEEKKKIRKSIKTKNFMESSDDDYVSFVCYFSIFPDLNSSHNYCIVSYI